jgi:hypothetical protein
VVAAVYARCVDGLWAHDLAGHVVPVTVPLHARVGTCHAQNSLSNRAHGSLQGGMIRGNMGGLVRGVYPEDDNHARALLASSPKLRSGWLQERQDIMREWGEYGISGLELR